MEGREGAIEIATRRKEGRGRGSHRLRGGTPARGWLLGGGGGVPPLPAGGGVAPRVCKVLVLLPVFVSLYHLAIIF